MRPGIFVMRLQSDRHFNRIVQRIANSTSLALMFALLSVTTWISGCGSSTQQVNVTPRVEGEEVQYSLSEPVPLPGNHDEKTITVSAAPSQAGIPGTGANTADNKSRKLTEFDPENMRVKANHWVAIQSEGVSVKEDFNGVLRYSMRRGDLSVKTVPGTRYFVRSRRPASLAAEQGKIFETPLFITDHTPLTILPELQTVSGSNVVSQPERLLPLKPYQYHMVLLTDRPETFRFLSVLPSIRNVRLNSLILDEATFDQDNIGPVEDYSSNASEKFRIESVFYKLTVSDWGNRVELPSNVQQWTSIAYLVWDDFSPERFSLEQQQALIDWIHFGGQLIVSGDAIDSLNQSFLKDYLPVRPTGSQNSPSSDLLPMLANWTLERNNLGELLVPSFGAADTFVRKTWELQESATQLPKTDGLVVEHNIGKGRVVAVAFPLNLPKLRSWTGLDNWFNSCLLRRMGRSHELDAFENQGLDLTGAGQGFSWTERGFVSDQAGVYSTLRFAARDWVGVALDDVSDNSNSLTNVPSKVLVDALSSRFENVSQHYSPGAWDDYSAIAKAARATLKDQAGITPPRRDWVLKALLAYLAVLVPLNYVVFKLMGRPEWAWFAIPVIAVAGAITVVRAAALDIGFSNKRLQVNVVEVPKDYTRAHVAGYGSLYSSLTSQFRFESENSTTIALPFPASTVPKELYEEPSEFTFEYGKRVKFGPQRVLSNTMEMYHFEQMADVGGTFGLVGNDEDGWKLRNGTRMNLRDVGVFRHDPRTKALLVCKIDSLPTESNVSISWKIMNDPRQVADTWQETCFADLVNAAEGLLARLEAAEMTPLLTPWIDVCDFFRQSEPEFVSALEKVAAQKAIGEDEVFSLQMLNDALKEKMLDQELSLGRLFRVVSKFPLGPGEARLVGWSDDRIDQWQVTPSASQFQQRNLVIGHLASPDLPGLMYDKNLAYTRKSAKNEQGDAIDAIDAIDAMDAMDPEEDF